MVNAFRYGFLGVSDVNVGVSFAIMGIFTVILLVWTLYLFQKGGGLKN
jgi:ABC-2 type transport system permease protein